MLEFVAECRKSMWVGALIYTAGDCLLLIVLTLFRVATAFVLLLGRKGEQGAEEDIWTEEGWGDGRMEKIE
jgi:hypothetical protein